jgi:ArsR family transcriptional regulator, lead/cadmium/zinc/bismuth-responsive transcriptional repressor
MQSTAIMAWQPSAIIGCVHLVPVDLSHRVIDGEAVCAALGAIGDCGDVRGWAQRFKVLADPSRLALLLCIHRAGPISVTDLAVAAGLNDTTVSQALWLLRAGGIVAARRDGRIVRYRLADNHIAALLDQLPAEAPEHDQPSRHSQSR